MSSEAHGDYRQCPHLSALKTSMLSSQADDPHYVIIGDERLIVGTDHCPLIHRAD